MKNLIQKCLDFISNIDKGCLDLRQGSSISKDRSWEEDYVNGSLGESNTVYAVWGYSPNKGFTLIGGKKLSFENGRPLPVCIGGDLNFLGEDIRSNYAHTEPYFKKGKTLRDIPDIEIFTHVLVRCEEYHNWYTLEQGCFYTLHSII
jgi:hypothetical protein